MANVLAIGDLERVMARSGGWIAASVAKTPSPTTTTFTLTGYDLSAAPSLADALVVVGYPTRQVGQVSSISGQTITLSTALANAPSVGDPVVIYPMVTVQATVSENVSEVGGTSLPAGQSGNPNLPVTLDGQTFQPQVELTSSYQLSLDSTTTPLAANSTYTTGGSGYFSLSGMRRIVGSAISDQSGTLLVQQSPDGSNWDIGSSFAVSAGTTAGNGVGFSVEVVCPYGRLVYNNGATAQTVFRLYAWGTPNS